MKHEYHMICLHWKYVNMSFCESPTKHSKIGKFPMSWKGASIFGRSSNGTISLHTEDHQGNAMRAVVPSTCTHMIHESTMLNFSRLGCPFCSSMWVNHCNRWDTMHYKQCIGGRYERYQHCVDAHYTCTCIVWMWRHWNLRWIHKKNNMEIWTLSEKPVFSGVTFNFRCMSWIYVCICIYFHLLCTNTSWNIFSGPSISTIEATFEAKDDSMSQAIPSCSETAKI